MPEKLKHITSYQSSSSEHKHVSIKSLQEIHVRSAMFWGTGSIGNALPANVKLLGPSCKSNGRDIRTQPFLTLGNWHLLTKGWSKGTRARQKTFKVLSLIPLYQGRLLEYMFSKLLKDSKQPNLLPKNTQNPAKFVA